MKEMNKLFGMKEDNINRYLNLYKLSKQVSLAPGQVEKTDLHTLSNIGSEDDWKQMGKPDTLNHPGQPNLALLSLKLSMSKEVIAEHLSLVDVSTPKEEMGKIFHIGRTAITNRINRNQMLKKSLSDKTNISSINEILSGKTHEEVANIYNLSRSRITQIAEPMPVLNKSNKIAPETSSFFVF